MHRYIFEDLSFCSHGVAEEVGVGEADAVGKLSAVSPAEGGGFAYIKEFARSAVGTGGVPQYLPFVADDGGNKSGELLYCQLFAGSGVDGLVAAVVVHQEHAEVSEVRCRSNSTYRMPRDTPLQSRNRFNFINCSARARYCSDPLLWYFHWNLRCCDTCLSGVVGYSH